MSRLTMVLAGVVTLWGAAPSDAWAARGLADVQDEQEELSADALFTTAALTEGGISILGVSRVGSSLPGTPVFGLIQNAAFEFHRIIGAAYPTAVVLAEPDAMDRIRAAGIQSDAARWLQAAAEGKRADDALLPRLASATGTRYLLRGEVIRFDTVDEEAPPFEPPQGLDNDLQPFLTRPKPFTVRKVVSLQATVWDARSRRLVWRAVGGVRAVEDQKAETLRMDDLFIRATKNLVALLPDKRLEDARAEISRLEARLQSATARVAQLDAQLRETSRRESEQAERLRLLELKTAELLAAQAFGVSPSPAPLLPGSGGDATALASTVRDLEARLLAIDAAAAARARDLQAAAVVLTGSLRDEIARGEAVVALQGLVGQGGGDVSRGGRGARGDGMRLTLRIRSEVLFTPGGAELAERGRRLLNRAVAALTGVGERLRIVVEGHTDTPPGGRPLEPFPTNWELSAAWAAAAARHLTAMGVDPAVLAAAGRGEHHPLVSNETEEGRRLNRRVEIILFPQELPL